jgi:hypothetical protein
MQMGTV